MKENLHNSLIRFQKSLQVFLDNAASFLAITAIFYLPLAIVYVLVMKNVDVRVLMEEGNPFLFRHFLWHYMFFSVVAFFVKMFFSVVIIRFIDARSRMETVPFLEAVKSSFPFLWVYVFVMLVVFIKVFLWSMLFFIPGIIFGMFYAFSGFAVLIDGYKGKAALAFSKDLVKDHLWEFLGNIIVLFPFLWGMEICIRGIIRLLFFKGEIAKAGFMLRTTESLTGFIAMYIGISITVYFYFLYQDFKRKKEV